MSKIMLVTWKAMFVMLVTAMAVARGGLLLQADCLRSGSVHWEMPSSAWRDRASRRTAR